MSSQPDYNTSPAETLHRHAPGFSKQIKTRCLTSRRGGCCVGSAIHSDFQARPRPQCSQPPSPGVAYVKHCLVWAAPETGAESMIGAFCPFRYLFVTFTLYTHHRPCGVRDSRYRVFGPTSIETGAVSSERNVIAYGQGGPLSRIPTVRTGSKHIGTRHGGVRFSA